MRENTPQKQSTMRPGMNTNNGNRQPATGNKHLVEETRGDGVGGKIQMSEDVVATIAGIAAREVKGIHALGRSRLIPFGSSLSRGIAAEVGNEEAALDLEVVIEHGCNIREVAQELRTKVAEAVKAMANREVVEVNLDIIGVHYEPTTETPSIRVR